MASYSTLLNFAAVGAGGMIGAMLRYGIQHLGLFEQSYCNTLTVNLTGSFLMGVVWVLLSRGGAPAWCNLLFMTGVLGGYTTYSAFSLDFVNLLRQSRVVEAFVYWGITSICAPALCALGYFITDKILK
ncbi:MAG: CrcB family protein [Muribaculaceae bacterium]|nr:CrcB family protein [Muribaculaceae bacterium]